MSATPSVSAQPSRFHFIVYPTSLTPHPEFNFYPSNHRVVRAEFGWPCYPYELANINKPGFDSGTFTPQVVSSNVIPPLNPPFLSPNQLTTHDINSPPPGPS